MSKVICDVCGTTYPETAAQCPICGCAKDSATQTTSVNPGSDPTEPGGSYSYVRGGRFSERNVRKRTSGNRGNERRKPAGTRSASGTRAAATARPSGTGRPANSRRRNTAQEDEKSNLGLIIIVIILLIAIIAVVIQLAVRYLGSDDQPDTDGAGSSQSSQTKPDPNKNNGTTNPSEPSGVACAELKLSHKIIQFVGAGSTENLTVQVLPENTTDKVIFKSSNSAVASVDEKGLVTAVGPGEAIITVTCGKITDTCQIKCSFGGNIGTDTPPEPPVGVFDFQFNTRYTDADGNGDTTLSKQGEIWNAYKAGQAVAANLITWTSDDPSVCTIDENGIVTAVGHGETQIHAQYNGVTYTCIVRCTFKETAGTGGDAETTGVYTISSTDVTLFLSGDNSFNLKLLDSNGKAVDVTWTASKNGIVMISGNKITGLAVYAKGVEVSTTYNGVTYTCIVRVHE